MCSNWTTPLTSAKPAVSSAPILPYGGISIPSGLSEGLPVGLQLVGNAFSENRILSAAHALEQAIDFDPVPPALRAASA